MWFLIHSDFFGMRFQNHFDSAGQRDGSPGNENYIFFLFLLLLIILYFSLMRSVFRRCVSGNLSPEVSATLTVASNLHTNHFIAACSVKISGWFFSNSLFPWWL